MKGIIKDQTILYIYWTIHHWSY